MIIIRRATEIRKDDTVIVRTYDSSDRSSHESHHKVKKIYANWKGRIKFEFYGGFTGPDVPQDAEIEVVI